MGKITQLCRFTKTESVRYREQLFSWSLTLSGPPPTSPKMVVIPPSRAQTSMRQETAVPAPEEALEYQETDMLVPSPSPLVHTLELRDTCRVGHR